MIAAHLILRVLHRILIFGIERSQLDDLVAFFHCSVKGCNPVLLRLVHYSSSSRVINLSKLFVIIVSIPNESLVSCPRLCDVMII